MLRVDLTVATITQFHVLLVYSLTSFLVQVVRDVRLNAVVFLFSKSQGLNAQHRLASPLLSYFSNITTVTFLSNYTFGEATRSY